MGVGTILEAREIILLAAGDNKSTAVQAAIEGPVTSMITASALQLHAKVRAYLDEAAAEKLEMVEYYEWVDQHRPNAPSFVPRPYFASRAKQRS